MAQPNELFWLVKAKIILSPKHSLYLISAWPFKILLLLFDIVDLTELYRMREKCMNERKKIF